MDSQKKYLENYDKYFKSLTNKEITLLELGVFKGESLKFWRDYFLEGTIIGIDINKVVIDDPSGRIHIYQGSQYDIEFLDSVSKKHGNYDVIIDDASHIGEFTKISFWYLFNNYLKQGGIFVIEDWGTGYYNKFPDGKKYFVRRIILMHKFQRLIDKIIKQTENVFINKTLLKRVILKLLRTIRIMSVKRKYKSHNYGLVGFVKELIDEMGMDIITSPSGNPKISGERKFVSMEIYPGQIFIVKR